MPGQSDVFSSIDFLILGMTRTTLKSHVYQPCYFCHALSKSHRFLFLFFPNQSNSQEATRLWWGEMFAYKYRCQGLPDCFARAKIIITDHQAAIKPSAIQDLDRRF